MDRWSTRTGDPPTKWAAAASTRTPDVPATNFGEPADLFEKLPRQGVFITDTGVPGK